MAKEEGDYYKVKENWDIQPNVMCGPSSDTGWIK